MKNKRYAIIISVLAGLLLGPLQRAMAQRTQVRGFADATAYYQRGKANFSFGEQDLFITSEITERLSFLGETVVKYSFDSPTDFDVSIERLIMKYNYSGNHSILIGKHHTPLNYWNDTYHHGRVFFPTIDRPLIFSEGIIPLHTTGVSLQGQNLGRLRFGYDFMLGNGLGSGDAGDNDKFKALTAAVHIKPRDGMRIGASMYHDILSKGSVVHNHYNGTSITALARINQTIVTGSLAYNDSIGSKKFELLAESSMVTNKSDSLGTQYTLATYAYAGLRLTDKIVPYIRVDDIRYRNGEVYFMGHNVQSFIGGLRYELSYLAVLKLEYQHIKKYAVADTDKVTFQIAVGF